MSSGEIRQLTRDSQQQSQPLFLTDGRLSYRQKAAFFAIELSSGFSQLLAEIKFAKAPSAPQQPMGYIAAQQHRLVKYVALQRHNKQLRQQRTEQLSAQNAT